MMIYHRMVGLSLLCGIVALTAACSRSPMVNFYTLAPSATTAAVAPAGGKYWVAVGPVTLPELVDRPQLVVRLESNQVDILETQRWAEPLKSQIPRLMADNLGRLLGSDRVSAYPQSVGNEADYRVLVDIQRFEAAGESVSIDAFWSVRKSTGDVVKTGRSTVTEPAGGSNYDALVTAYSRALLAVTNDIAIAIRSEGLTKQ